MLHLVGWRGERNRSRSLQGAQRPVSRGRSGPDPDGPGTACS
jgi:hypothetical protein